MPREIVEADLADGYPQRRAATPWGSTTMPHGVAALAARGAVKAEAAAITVPVFLGFGRRDISADMHAEVAAFPSSADFSLYVAPRMAHMHNFAGTRRQFWDRLADWSQMIGRTRTSLNAEYR